MARFNSSSRARRRPGRRRNVWVFLFAVVGVVIVTGLPLLSGCGVDQSPLRIETVEVGAVPGGIFVTLPDGSIEQRRNLIDGIRTDVEWLDAPVVFIAVNGADGTGGGAFDIAMSAVYDQARLYMLFQWPDATPDDRGPRLIFEPDTAISDMCDDQIVGCHWTLFDDDEDRLVIMFDADQVSGGRPGSFQSSPAVALGAPSGSAFAQLQGMVDIWHWRAARTNPVNYTSGQSRPRIGFADDEFATSAGRSPDPGASLFVDNFRLIDCPEGQRPVPLSFPQAINNDGQPTTAINDSMRPCDYIYQPTARTVTNCSTRNPCREFDQQEVVNWVTGDDAAAFMLRHPLRDNEREPRHDILARGRWLNNAWTVEVVRLLRTGDTNDVQFDLSSTDTYSLTLAAFNNSGEISSGSPTVQLRFRP